MCLFISALFVSCLQITKRAVAWVGSVQQECTVRLGTWIFRIFKPKFLSNESGLGAGIFNKVTVLLSIRRKAFRTCFVPWRLYVDRSRKMKCDKRDWREHEGLRGPGNEESKSAIPSPMALWKQALSDWETSRGLEQQPCQFWQRGFSTVFAEPSN